MALALIVFLLLYLTKTFLGKDRLLPLPLLIPIALVVFAFSCSFAATANPSDSFPSLIGALCALLIFVIGVKTFQTQNRVDDFFAFLVPILWMELLLSATQGFLFHHPDLYDRARYSNSIAFYFLRNAHERCGSLVNANLLAVFTLPLTFPLIQKTLDEWEKSRGRALFFLSGTFAALGCIVLTKSASGVVGFLIGLILMMRKNAPFKNYVKHAVAFLAIVFVAAVLYKYTHAYDRVVDPFNNPNNRFYWWVAALRMFFDHPLFGIGPGGFQAAYLAYKSGGIQNTFYTHNFILTLLAETGVIGTASFAIFAWQLCKQGLAKNHTAFIGQAITPALVSVLCFYSYNFGYEYPLHLMMLAILGSMVFANVNLPVYRIRLSALLICYLISFGSLPFLVSPFLASQHTVDGNTYIKEENWVLAEKHFNIAHEIDNLAWEPYVGLATAAFDQGDIQKAVEMQEEALKRNQLSIPLKRELVRYQLFLRKNAGSGL